MDYKYTLAFIKRGNKVLMLNRNFAPWKGSWNGVGGKLKNHELPIDGIIREIKEETNIDVSLDQIIDKGIVTWNSYDVNGTGLYVFLVNLEETYIYETPKVTDEGLLDWKEIDWIASFDNYGVCHNIPYFINHVLNDNKMYNHKCIFDKDILVSVTSEILK